MAAKKIAGVDRKVFLIAAVGVILVGLYLRSRANNAASTSAAAPAASSFDSGLGTGGGGAAGSTPTDNGLGSSTNGTDALMAQESTLFGSLISAYQVSSQANADLAANAGTYINTTTTDSHNTYYGGNISPVTNNGDIGHTQSPRQTAAQTRAITQTVKPVALPKLNAPSGWTVTSDSHGR